MALNILSAITKISANKLMGVGLFPVLAGLKNNLHFGEQTKSKILLKNIPNFINDYQFAYGINQRDR